MDKEFGTSYKALLYIKECAELVGLEVIEGKTAFDVIFMAEIMKRLREEQEPKTGNWITHPKGIYAHLICDKCLSNAPYDCRTNYCPNCGARMIESEVAE